MLGLTQSLLAAYFNGPGIIDHLQKNPPGLSVKKAAFSKLERHAQNGFLATLRNNCEEQYKRRREYLEMKRDYKQIAKNYLAMEGGERDHDWEKSFAERYTRLEDGLQKATAEVHSCDEWFKVISGKFP